MGRSVSRPSNAEVVCYLHRDFEDEFDWDMWIEDVAGCCKDYWPSLYECDKWLDREDHAILENDLVYIGVSEYCGLVAIWIVPKDTGYWWGDYSGLVHHWIGQIEPQFEKLFSELVYGGSFSNGEAVFHYKDNPDHHRTSKGYDDYNI